MNTYPNLQNNLSPLPEYVEYHSQPPSQPQPPPSQPQPPSQPRYLPTQYVPPPTPLVVSRNVNLDNIEEGKFQHGFCSCCSGGYLTCLFAWFFTPCLNASTRNDYDESNVCFNCCCLSGAMARNMIREGYKIEGDCCTDMLLSCIFPCCSAIQLRSEVNHRGIK